MALLALKVTTAVTPAGGSVAATTAVKSASVAISGQISVTNGSGITQGAADGRYTHQDGTGLVATYSLLNPAYGGKCNAKRVTDGVVSGGSLGQVSSVSAAFTSGDVGKAINIDGAAAGGKNHGTTIASVSSGIATLTLAASTAVTGATVTYGTDDTVALQAASDAATAAPLGGTVLIPGDTMITTIVPGSNITYTSAPGSTIYQVYNYMVNVSPMFIGSALTHPAVANISNVRFVGLWLEGDGNPLFPHEQAGIFITPSVAGTDVEISDCKLNNHAANGITVTNCDVVTVERNRLTNCATIVAGQNAINVGPGATASTSGDWTIAGNRVSGSGATAGIDIYSTGFQAGYKTRATITGNIIRNRGWVGIAVEANGGCNDVTVAGNGVYDSVIGIEASNTGGGYNPTYADMRNLTIAGNTIDNGTVSGSQGIVVSQMSNTTVSGNVVRAAVPLFIGGASASNRINSVTATGNTLTYGGLTAGPSSIAQITWADRVIFAANACLVESEVDWLTLGNATAGTFTLSVTDNHAHTYGPTAGIAWNAAPSAVQSALQAVLPAAITANIVVTGGPVGLPGGSVEIVFTGSLGGQPITLTGNFAGLTGGAGVITRTVPGSSVSGYGIFLNDVYDTTVVANTVSHAGRAGINATDARDSVIAQNAILDPCEANLGGHTFAIQQAGVVGAGLTVRENTITDRRVNPLMTYGVSATGTSPVRLRGNSVHGQVTGTYTGSAVSYEAPPPSTTIVTTTNASWPIPAESNFLEIICVGGGGGGGGGGSPSSAILQAGGAGGSPGGSQGQITAVGANTILSVTIGTAGTAGTTSAAGGNPGGNGGNGGDTTVTATGISVRAKGGAGGNGSLASSTAQAQPHNAWGTNAGATSVVQGAMQGGYSGAKGGWPVGWSPGGGGGGGAATATLGGAGGAPGTADDGGAGGAAGGSGTANGTSGAATTVPGSGGGGGGGGATAAGTGAAGIAGMTGLAIIKVVG